MCTTGKQEEAYSPSPRDTEQQSPMYSFENVYQDPESLILAMERVTVLFDRYVHLSCLSGSFGYGMSQYMSCTKTVPIKQRV